MATTEVSVNNFTVFVILIVMSLMFFDKKLIASVLVITMLTHMVFSGLKASSITEVDTLSGLLIFIVFIGATYSLLKIFDEAIMLVKNSTEKRKDDLGHVGRIADYIYEQVTQLEAETNMLKKGSNEFQVSLQEVTKAIEDIAAGSLSVVADTEKIASYIAELEKTVSDNHEHIKCVTDNMNEIIDNKNQGLKLMSELSNLTKTTSKAIAEIDKMVNETSANTNRIVSAGEVIKQIATQTNLLALNAAIEATKAEHSGKGFTIIADEIKSLSEETNKYVKEIKTYTTSLTNSVANAIKALGEVNTAIENEVNGVKDMDNLLEKIHESTTSTQDYINKLNRSGKTILEQTVKIKESIANLYAVNEECSACTCQASNNMRNQNPYVDSIINLINNLCEMVYKLRDKSMEIKMLIDIGLLIDYLEKEGYSNEKLIEICRKLNITSAYVADETGYVHYCNEEIGRGVNLFAFDQSLKQLLHGVDYIATPIKQRVEDGKTYKFLAVYRNNKIYELGIDLSQGTEPCSDQR